MSADAEIKFNQKELSNIPYKLGVIGFSRFAEELRTAVTNFIPRDTDTLINSWYTKESDDGKSYVFGYGSPDNDYLKINKIAIYQHERTLRHNGLPGVSMRHGVAGSNIPGIKHWEPGSNSEKIRDSAIKTQYAQYQKGYRAKRKNGQLQTYSSQYLKRGLEVVNGKSVSELYKSVNLEIEFNKLKSDLKAGW